MNLVSERRVVEVRRRQGGGRLRNSCLLIEGVNGSQEGH